MCKSLDGGQSSQRIIDAGNAKNGSSPDTETLRQIWGVIFTAVLVYCPQYQDQLPTERRTP